MSNQVTTDPDDDAWEKYDGWERPESEEDPDEGYDRMRQNEVDDSLFGLAADISRLQGLTMCKRQA